MQPYDKILINSRIVPLLVLCLVIFVMLIIPMKITGYGFLPPDDALRHSAKAISGKTWNEILVLRSDIKMDSHPGWHSILGFVHKITNCDADSLVVFSIVSLFALFCLVPLFMLRYHEAWLIALMVIITANYTLIYRLLLGRPYIVTMSTLLLLCFLWPNLRDKKTPYKILIILTLAIAASIWIHGSWYLFTLPLLCFFLAREWRAGIRVGMCIFAGIIIGAPLTRHPYLFLTSGISHMFNAFGNHQLQRTLVGEFQVFSGDSLIVIAVLGVLAWRNMRLGWNPKVIDNPVFMLAALSWVLGFVANRFWLDWGLPAAAVWMAQEFEEALNVKMDILSWRRVLLAIVVGAAFYISATSDINSRWTSNLTTEYLSPENPKQASWLPEPGGIIYSDDMTIFYQTFFKNPHAPWRYILGFEPTMMPREDLAILRKIQWNFGAYEAFEPWVKKMRPRDRLIIRRGPDTPPKIAGLEWYYAATGIWIGRLPR